MHRESKISEGGLFSSLNFSDVMSKPTICSLRIQPFSPGSSPIGTFPQEERLRLSYRNSILMTQNLFRIWSGAVIGGNNSQLFINLLFWAQASPEGICTNGTQGPCEVPSLPNPTTRKGWLHHRGLRPLLFSNSDVGSFTFHKNKSVKFVITKCSKYDINVRQQSKRGSVLHKIFFLQECHTVVLGNVLSGNVTL